MSETWKPIRSSCIFFAYISDFGDPGMSQFHQLITVFNIHLLFHSVLVVFPIAGIIHLCSVYSPYCNCASSPLHRTHWQQVIQRLLQGRKCRKKVVRERRSDNRNSNTQLSLLTRKTITLIISTVNMLNISSRLIL